MEYYDDGLSENKRAQAATEAQVAQELGNPSIITITHRWYRLNVDLSGGKYDRAPEKPELVAEELRLREERLPMAEFALKVATRMAAQDYIDTTHWHFLLEADLIEAIPSFTEEEYRFIVQNIQERARDSLRQFASLGDFPDAHAFFLGRITNYRRILEIAARHLPALDEESLELLAKLLEVEDAERSR